MSEPTGTPAESPAEGSAPSWTLHQFPEKLAVVRLPAGAEIPTWAESSSIFSITATATETSLVCAGRSVPTKARAIRGLTAFQIAGTIPWEQAGVLAGILAPLAEEGISAFTLSTFDTDWILVPQQHAERAAQAWRRAGQAVEPAPIA
ncbi:ACT domain-containing protein [Nocardioides sp. R-C-SC26]|uniref:ACT domain-containing protein n=1 Tax=Nocardioides sp. R-C-SC26 TaxID=2870414 RepID=UPI001E551E1A|nr:ACT domain-containing protein [Nocardioides sp. R-C-SC26]